MIGGWTLPEGSQQIDNAFRQKLAGQFHLPEWRQELEHRYKEVPAVVVRQKLRLDRKTHKNMFFGGQFILKIMFSNGKLNLTKV